MNTLVRILALLTLCAAVLSPALAASWLDQPPTPDQMLSNRRSIHQAVLALEREPLHKNAALITESGACILFP